MHVRDVLVLEAPHNVRHRVALADVPEELVSETLARARPLHKARDVHEINRRVDNALAFRDLREGIQTTVRHHRNPEVRVNGGERIVLSLRPRLRQTIEYRRFADVRQPHNSDFHKRECIKLLQARYEILGSLRGSLRSGYWLLVFGYWFFQQ